MSHLAAILKANPGLMIVLLLLIGPHIPAESEEAAVERYKTQLY